MMRVGIGRVVMGVPGPMRVVMMVVMAVVMIMIM